MGSSVQDGERISQGVINKVVHSRQVWDSMCLAVLFPSEHCEINSWNNVEYVPWESSKTDFTARERIKGVLQVTLAESITP